MPILWLHALAGILISIAGSLIGRILLYLGVASINYTGLSIVFDTLQTFVFSQSSGITGPPSQMLGYFHLGDCMQMIISAGVTKMILAGASPNGAIFRWHLRVPSSQGSLF